MNIQNRNGENSEQEAAIGTYHGFLIRMWRDGHAGLWRSSAQSVRTGEVTRFASLTKLFAFLEAQTNGPPEKEEKSVGWRSPIVR